MAKQVIGIDFDNTLISYDDLIHTLAVEQKLIPSSFVKQKKEIRDYLRTQPGGEIEWQKIQALIYGARIGEAQLIEGVKSFLRNCAKHGIKVYIVSHKTEFSNLYKDGINFRASALQWMQEHLFSENLSAQEIFFTSTQEEKIAKIAHLGCTHFIDDLEEVLNAPHFPEKTVKILFSLQGGHSNNYSKMCLNSNGSIKIFSRWAEINNYFFDNNLTLR